MCLAIPAKIIEINGEKGIVELGGVKKEISLVLVPEAKVGDYAIIHVGFAIQILDEEEARKTLEIFEEIYGDE